MTAAIGNNTNRRLVKRNGDKMSPFESKPQAKDSQSEQSVNNQSEGEAEDSHSISQLRAGLLKHARVANDLSIRLGKSGTPVAMNASGSIGHRKRCQVKEFYQKGSELKTVSSAQR